MRSDVFVFKSDNIPAELKQVDQWVCWREELVRKKNGATKTTKVPYNARTGQKASSTDSDTWSTYEEAVSAVDRLHCHGVGFVLTGDGIIASDLDHCVDTDKRIAPWALEIVAAFSTYWEFSPSGEGLRGLFRGKLPPTGRKKGNIEVYETERYVTVTGNHLDSTPPTIEDCSAQLLALHAKVWATQE